MKEFHLKAALKNRLRKRNNKKFIALVNKLCRPVTETEGHHILESFIGGKKQNDLLITFISPMFHKIITYNREPTEEEFIDMLIDAIENLSDVVEYLIEKDTILNPVDYKEHLSISNFKGITK